MENKEQRRFEPINSEEAEPLESGEVRISISRITLFQLGSQDQRKLTNGGRMTKDSCGETRTTGSTALLTTTEISQLNPKKEINVEKGGISGDSGDSGGQNGRGAKQARELRSVKRVRGKRWVPSLVNRQTAVWGEGENFHRRNATSPRCF